MPPKKDSLSPTTDNNKEMMHLFYCMPKMESQVTCSYKQTRSLLGSLLLSVGITVVFGSMMGLVLASFFKSVKFIKARKEGTLLGVLYVRKSS